MSDSGRHSTTEKDQVYRMMQWTIAYPASGCRLSIAGGFGAMIGVRDFHPAGKSPAACLLAVNPES